MVTMEGSDDSLDDEFLNQIADEVESASQHVDKITSIPPSATNLGKYSPSQMIETSIAIPDPVIQKWLPQLKKAFGHSQFKDHQIRILKAALVEKRDQLVVAATGYGKSLCYQFPPVASAKTTLVVSPLISLMEDQVLNLGAMGIKAAFLGSAQTRKDEVYGSIDRRELRLLYLTPEFLDCAGGDALLSRLGENQLCLVAIDEAHCISQWGHDFRSAYRSLGKLRAKLPKVPFMALTGTATGAVRADIAKNLGLRNALVTTTSFDRPNLRIEIRRKGTSPTQDLSSLLVDRFNQEPKFGAGGSTIIYAPTKKDTDELCVLVRKLGVRAAPYHAGLSPALRSRTHKDFSQDRISTVVATVAFGMGIDKPDIRNVVHYGAPKDMESYYQEMGRAGRDGLPAVCTVFWAPGDFVLNKSLLSSVQSPEFREYKLGMVEELRRLFESLDCRRRSLLGHFEEGDTGRLKPREDCCDRCRENLRAQDEPGGGTQSLLEADGRLEVGQEAWMLFVAIDEITKRTGLNLAITVLRGSENEKVRRLNCTGHRVHGTGKHRSENWWKALGSVLKTEGFLKETAFSQGFGGGRGRGGFGGRGGYRSFASYFIELTEKALEWLTSAEKAKARKVTPSLRLKPTSTLLDACPSSAFAPNSAGRGPGIASPVSCAKPAVKGEAKLLPQIKIRIYQDAVELGLCPAEESPEEDNESLEMTLYERLESARAEAAEAEELAPYMLASNKALLSMAHIRPTHAGAFEDVDEFPEEKVRRFGPTFLGVVAEFLAENPGLAAAKTEKDVTLREEDLPANIRRLMAHLKPTTLKTYELHLLSRSSLTEIGRLRSLAAGTVLGHLATAGALGLPLRLGACGVSAELRTRVLKAAREPPLDSDIRALRPILEALGGEAALDFGRLRLCVSLLEFEFGLSDEAAYLASEDATVKDGAKCKEDSRVPGYLLCGVKRTTSGVAAPPSKKARASVLGRRF